MIHQRTTFESVHMEYQSMVRQMCTGFVKGDREQADDLSQEVFINVWNALEKFRGESSIKTWIYRITVNTCLQYIRKEKRNTKVPLEVAGDVRQEIHDNREEGAAKLYKAIGQLEEVDRLVIMMVLDELEYEEIARVVGISENNLRVKIHRIKQRLKTILEDGNRNE